MRDVSLSASKFQDFPEERVAPRRRGSVQPFHAAPAPSRAPKQRPSTLARVFAPRRMGVLVLLGIGGLAFVGVPMNALFLQDGRHPAPLFAARPAAPPKTAEAPTPPARPAQIETARVEAGVGKTEAARVETSRAPKAVGRSDAAALRAEILKSEAAPAARPEKKREAARDPIGALLGGGAATEARTPDKGVMSAQRALQRLGYVVKADGLMGAGTRQAIERFERDNGLPVKGELSPKIVKLLAARTAARQ